MKTESYFYTAKEIADILRVSLSEAYRRIEQLNAELSAKGYMVARGKVSRKYFDERYYMG